MKRIQTIVTFALLAFLPSSVVWMNFVDGYGGLEELLALAMIPVVVCMLVAIAGAAWVVSSAVWSAVRLRPLSLPFLKLGIVISILSTVAMLHFVARKAKCVGAMVRISSLGGDNFLLSLHREAQALAAKAETLGVNHFESSDLAAEFRNLGVDYATVSGSSCRYIVTAIVRPGHLQTEWVITSHEDIDIDSPGAIPVTKTIYRY